MVLIGTGFVCSTVSVTTGDRAAGRDRGGGRRRSSPWSRVHGGGCVVGGGVAHGTAVRVTHTVSFRLDDHLGPFRGHALIVRHYERRVLLLRDAHVVTDVGFLHYVARTLERDHADEFSEIKNIFTSPMEKFVIRHLEKLIGMWHRGITRIQKNAIFVKFRKFRRFHSDQRDPVFTMTVKRRVSEGFALVFAKESRITEYDVINLVAWAFTVKPVPFFLRLLALSEKKRETDKA